MAKILCPNKQYTGVSATIAFVNGVGETDKPYLIEWFKKNGYTVEDGGESKRRGRKKPPVDKLPADEPPGVDDEVNDEGDEDESDEETENQD